MEFPETKAAISGIGQSQIGRRLMRTGISLTAEAALAAIDHAGLEVKDIDGLSCWPGAMASDPGMGPVAVAEVKEALDLKLNWFYGGPESPGQLGSIFNAVMAVVSGQAKHVLCYRTLVESTLQGKGKRGVSTGSVAERRTDHFQWLIPFSPTATNWTGVYAQRYFHDYGLKREQLGQIPLTLRGNAQKNPLAVYKDPMSMDDYLSARMISTPLCLFDCDVPIDGATAIIVSSVDAAKELPNSPLRVEAMSGALWGRDSWDQRSDLTTMAAHDAAAAMWQRTKLTPQDVDVAQLYDGFSIYTVMWLNAMGFVSREEMGEFLEGGERIALDGELPLNTGGGQLSAGRLHGFGHLHEACVQLWQLGGERQVTKKDPSVVAVGVGGGPMGGCLLLSRDS